MPRKRLEITNLNTGRRNDLQCRFLEATNRVCPEVAEDLKKVRRGELQFDQFAERYWIRGTWIEEAARSTLDAWEHNKSGMEAASFWRLPSFAEPYPHGHPQFKQTRRFMSSFNVSSYLFSPDGYRQAFHAAVDLDLDEISRWAASEGYTVAQRIPKDLTKKLECTSLYQFRSWTVVRLAKQKEWSTDPTNMWRWISGVLKLLELPLRGRGKSVRKYCEKPDQ
jgi:hypothetical protein